MFFGHTGKILRVDLTRGTCTVQQIDDDLYRRYPGGKALAGYFLLTEMPAHADPLGPDNVLVLANGLLTGALLHRHPVHGRRVAAHRGVRRV